MVEMVNLFEPHTYVELGVKRGYTFNTISPMVKRAIAVDMNGTKYIKRLSNVETFDMTTYEFSKMWEDPIDMLFIDACHDKDYVISDFVNIGKYVKEGTGLILMHDTYPVKEELLDKGYCSDAWEAAYTIHSHSMFDSYEIVTLPGPWAGLSIARRVGTHHLQWKATKEVLNFE